MKMQIKGILFDFDGTIANTIDLIIATFEHTCQEVLGFTPEREKIVATFGLPLPEAMIALSGKPELVETMRDAYREYNNAHHDDMIRPIPGVKETLEQLKAQGIKLAVVTSKKPPMLRRGMDCLQLTPYLMRPLPWAIQRRANRIPSRCWRRVLSWGCSRRSACASATVPLICRADVVRGCKPLPCAIRPLAGRSCWRRAGRIL